MASQSSGRHISEHADKQATRNSGNNRHCKAWSAQLSEMLCSEGYAPAIHA